MRNATTAARVILAAIPLYAQALAGSVGVNVVFRKGASTAQTDGETVILPQLPLPLNDNDTATAQRLDVLITGMTAHECGHIRHTDFSYVPDATAPKALRSLFNAIEDPRQEAAFIKQYAGLRHKLDVMCEALIGVPNFYEVLTVEDQPLWLVTAYTMYSLRAELREQDAFAKLADDSRPALVAIFGEAFVKRLDIICDTDGRRLRSSADSRNMANQIMVAMAEEQQKQDQKPPQGEDDQGDQDEPSQSGDDADGSSAAGGDAGDQQSGNGSQSGSDDQGDGDGQQPGDQQAGDQGNDGSGQAGTSSSNAGNGGGDKGPDSDAISRALADAQNATDGGLEDLGTFVSKAISDEIQDIKDKGSEGYVGDSTTAMANVDEKGQPNRPIPRGTFDATNALRYTGQLRMAMQNELAALSRRREHETIRGNRLNQRTLHRTSSGDPRIFSRVEERKDLNTAVMILLDQSGSMGESSNPRIVLAEQAAFTIAVALNGLRGVQTAVGTFPLYEQVLRFGEKPTRTPDNFSVRTSGLTPLHEGVLWASRQLMRRREDRKILMVVTDGEPDHVASARAQILAAEHHGIETMGIGIELPKIAKLFDKSGVIQSMDELTPMMMSMIRGTLRSQLMAA